MEAGKPKYVRSLSSLPYDVIFNILKYLPVKTLLKCRCVCKEWNFIITGQSFINAHLLSQPQGYLFCHYYEPSVPSSSTFDRTQLFSFFPGESFSLVHKFKAPLTCSFQRGHLGILVGSFDGLLCLTNSKSSDRELYLWNPSIRKCKILSNSCLFDGNIDKDFSTQKRSLLVLGFMFIPVPFFKWSRRLKTNPLPQAEIYSLSTDSWKKMAFPEDVSKRLMDVRPWHHANLNGDVNWMATFSDEEGRPYQSILSFDVNEEEFKEIRLPSDYKNGMDVIVLRIEVYRGSLAVIVSVKALPNDGNNYAWLWVMEDYGNVDSWTRRTFGKMGPRSLPGCTLDGRIMFSRRRSASGRKKVELFDMETLEEHQFWVPDFQSVLTFKVTLLSPGS